MPYRDKTNKNKREEDQASKRSMLISRSNQRPRPGMNQHANFARFSLFRFLFLGIDQTRPEDCFVGVFCETSCRKGSLYDTIKASRLVTAVVLTRCLSYFPPCYVLFSFISSRTASSCTWYAPERSPEKNNAAQLNLNPRFPSPSPSPFVVMTECRVESKPTVIIGAG